MSVVRENLLTREWYSPYCGDEHCEAPRTEWDGEQFVCPACGWRSQFPQDFIKRYEDFRATWRTR